METHFFAGLDGGPRSEKPREEGRTMVVDWGLGPHAQEDLVVTGAAYVDFAKVAIGFSRLYSNEVLSKKIEHYQAHGIEPFPGGQYMEYAGVEGKSERYLPAVCKAGYRWVEVSDNQAGVSLDWKLKMIRSAREAFGLSVLGEVGQKEGLQAAVSMVDDVKACLDAGAEIVLLEAAELVSDDPRTKKQVDEVIKAVDLKRLMFELPGPWIPGISLHEIHGMRRQLIDRHGPEANIGNVLPDDLIDLEAYRRGLGITAGRKCEA